MFLGILLLAALLVPQAQGEWPMLRGGPDHSGLLEGNLAGPWALEWTAEFEGERIGTGVEPVLWRDTLFIGSHGGNLFALEVSFGQAKWRFHAPGAFLNSAAVFKDVVIAADSAGGIYGLAAADSSLKWRQPGAGGYAAAPIIYEGRVYLGSRSGELVALDGNAGTVSWKQELNVPIRQTAAAADGKVFVAGEDLRLRCFNATNGAALWVSERMFGQTARDSYPIFVRAGERKYVVVRTNPLLNMAARIAQDRTFLARNAGADDSRWDKLDAWIKSDAATGRPELWAREQEALMEYLRANPDAQTFYVYDADTGRKAFTAPVLWIGGCQGVGAGPALTSDGKLLVFYRSAFGNWNHGVAPLVTLGLLDLGTGRISPLFHRQGRQPPWNTFWGTADEAQSFQVFGEEVLIVHQGTLSRFDLSERNLLPIWGERDSYGGWPNPPWARNEWHGPARAGVAVADGRLYWQTGSRIICLAKGTPGRKQVTRIEPAAVRAIEAPAAARPSRASRVQELRARVDELISRRWCPLYLDPGLSGREFFFDRSAATFEALAFAWSQLDADLQKKVRVYLREELSQHPPFGRSAGYPLGEGEPREWFQVPASYRSRSARTADALPFGQLWPVWLWARKAGEEQAVIDLWPQIKTCYEEFTRTKWALDAAKGDLHANAYIASLDAFAEIARRAGEDLLGAEAERRARTNKAALIDWWKRAAEKGTLHGFKNSSELDPFIGKGDLISFAIAPHRHKIALFHELSPELFEFIQKNAPEALARVWKEFSGLYRTWPLQGEERQVHHGENFVDGPVLALGAFKVVAWGKRLDGALLVPAVDIPFCRADVFYVEKLALALGDGGAGSGR